MNYAKILDRVMQDPRGFAEIARAAGLPPSTLRSAFQAKHGPRADTVEKLAALFNKEDKASKGYSPDADLPRRCDAYRPGRGDEDQRTGAERWPTLDRVIVHKEQRK